jgi:hypothetical protein
MSRLPVRRPGLLLLLATAALPGALRAQLQPITVPKGEFRFDFGGTLSNWDRRYLDGVKQDAAGDFIRSPADAAWLPSLNDAQQRLRQVTGVADLALSLGSTSASILANSGTSRIGAAWGVTRRLTLFGTVPIVRVRVQNQFKLDSTNANVGLNPASAALGTPAGQSTYLLFISQLGTALGRLTTNLAGGVYDGDAAQKARAQATLARGTALRDGLGQLYAAAFIPLAGTPAATALTQSIDTVRQRLAGDLGIPGFVAAPPLATTPIGTGGFQDFVTKPEGPIAGRPFTPPVLSYLGDIEVGAAYLWLDTPPGPGGGVGIRSTLQGLVRLRTGRLDQPDDFFDLPTGDRQPDVQGDLVTDVSSGRLGVRLTGRYVLQLPGLQQRRVGPPDQPFAPASTLAAVERDPGEIVEVGAEPFIRIARTLAFSAGARHWSKGADTYRYAAGQDSVPGVTLSDLARGSRENGTVLSAGISFVHDGARLDGTRGLPMDASFRYERVVASTLGRVPASESVVISLRFYGRVFGP